MDTPSQSAQRTLSIGEIHRAIETMAANQALIAVAVSHLLHVVEDDQPPLQSVQELITRIDRSVDQLNELAKHFVELPYDD